MIGVCGAGRLWKMGLDLFQEMTVVKIRPAPGRCQVKPSQNHRFLMLFGGERGAKTMVF